MLHRFCFPAVRHLLLFKYYSLALETKVALPTNSVLSSNDLNSISRTCPFSFFSPTLKHGRMKRPLLIQMCHTEPWLRLRLPSELIDSRAQIESGLFHALALMSRKPVLKYLLFAMYTRGGRGDYQLNEGLKELVAAVENSASAKGIEIIWENHEDHFRNSLVSKEFWKRCKTAKETVSR